MPPHQSQKDLSLLTLEAASEVDRRLKGGVPNSAIFHVLGDNLSSFSNKGETLEAAFLHYDPAMTEIFAKAAESSSKQSIQNIAALAEFMQDIISELNTQDDIDPVSLQKLKKFCLDLHKSLSAASIPLHDWESHFDNEVALA